MAVTTHAGKAFLFPLPVPYPEDNSPISDVSIYPVYKQTVIACDTEYISCKRLLLLNIVFVAYSLLLNIFIINYYLLRLKIVVFNIFVFDSMSILYICYTKESKN